MNHIPFPSRPNVPANESNSVTSPPWKKIKPGDFTPMMFQLRLNDGSIISYSYGDVRELRLVNSGELQVFLYGMEKYMISITGRRLGELAGDLGLGRIRWIAECDPRETDRPEKCPAIESIKIEVIASLEFGD